MKKNNILTVSVVLTACLCAGSVRTAKAQNTIQAGIMSCIANNGAFTAGTVDSAYVTAVFGTNAYIQDTTGAIYMYKALNATQGISGLAVGDQISGLSNSGFYYYTTGTQFELEPTNSSTAYADTGLTTGTIQSIPASYYTTLTLSTFNSTAAQGSSTSQGMQNQLVTIANVTISGAGGTFASGSYTMTDANSVTGTLYVNAASGLVGTAIPSGSVTVSGVFQDFKGASELLPRAASDVSAIPEPSAETLLGCVALGLTLAKWRSRRISGSRGCCE